LLLFYIQCIKANLSVKL